MGDFVALERKSSERVTRQGSGSRIIGPTPTLEHMRKIVLTYGLIAGAILSVMMLATALLSDRIGFDRGEIIGYTTMVAAFLMIFFGVKAYRDTVAGGTIRFARAFAVGAAIWAVAAVCYVATWQVVHRTVWPDFFEQYAAHAEQKARAAGTSESEIVRQRAELAKYREMYRNPVLHVALTLLEPLPVGLVMTLLSAGVLSRRRREPAGGMSAA